MSVDPISAIFDLGKTAIEKIWPDANKRAEELRKLEELRAKGASEELQAHVQLLLAQIEVNKIEAQHPSLFVAGGRPFVIWIGGISLAYTFLLHPLLEWLVIVLQNAGKLGATIPLPDMPNPEVLLMLISALLGVGGLRSFDKMKGTQTNEIKKP